MLSSRQASEILEACHLGGGIFCWDKGMISWTL
jgi:hypothetical protein